jgi:hypothetical protein
MRALSSDLRKQLETSVLAARRAAEGASRAAVDGLGVFLRDKPGHLDANQAALRIGLRAKWRQLGEDRESLIAECAYEQWHRLLFARFLAENNLLLHPQYKAPVTLADCDELAAELGEPDGWSVAARFAAEILPGIFRLDDPCFRLRLAPEGRYALEQILDGLPEQVFVADDALGWVYQFWKKERKDEVNDSERKIGGVDLGPVTQLFTENYMVRFLLENSLGAWWAARHPESSLVKDFDYLRLDDDGRPASGSFEGWPDLVSDVTVMDPCCGSGHFLVEAFSMLWQMRAEEEGLGAVDAQDAVLRDNLFGLELDARCVQIAMFAVALQAWKTGGSWRQLPIPNIACSGIPVKASVKEWKELAGGDERLENALVRLHILFRDADTLGSLIDPKRATEISDPSGMQRSTEDVDWTVVAPLLAPLIRAEPTDPASSVLGADAAGIARAAEFLSRHFTLVATNVPYLGRGKQGATLLTHIERHYRAASLDLAGAMQLRCLQMADATVGVAATVTPQTWTYLSWWRAFRELLLSTFGIQMIAKLGAGAFEGISGEVVQVVLGIVRRRAGGEDSRLWIADFSSVKGAMGKAAALKSAAFVSSSASLQSAHLESRLLADSGVGEPLGVIARVFAGSKPGQTPRVVRNFWEVDHTDDVWLQMSSVPDGVSAYSGKSLVILNPDEMRRVGVTEFDTVGGEARGRRGVLIAKMGDLPSSLYEGSYYDDNTYTIIPKNESDLTAIFTWTRSEEFRTGVRVISQKTAVPVGAVAATKLDVDHWRKVGQEADPLAEPWSDNPTQWLFRGRPEVSTAPMQAAVGRLLGYRWPRQEGSDDLDHFADVDGIVCVPSVAGEAPAAERLQQLLAAAFDEAWSPAKVREFLGQAGSTRNTLADWLRDEFFKQHCALFGNRPFAWHVWDGLRDGFSALVNYHRLDRKVLEKLTYTYLGQDWVERQRAGVRDDVAGAEARLAAALDLQHKLEAILEGERPYDIYVRWKELDEQSIGWEPDLNDGVRLNIRPFVKAGVLRSPFNIHWKKDRGRNPDGSERHNDIHLSLAEKRDARKRAGRT